MKKLLLWILAFSMAIPFVLTTNFYPFLRFGMYAEPVPNEIEIFALKYRTNESSFENFDTNLIGLDESMMNYAIRHHFYQDKMPIFQQKLIQSYHKSQQKLNIEAWQVWQYKISTDKKDSVLIQSFSQSSK